MFYQVGFAWLLVFALKKASSLPIAHQSLATRDLAQNSQGKQEGSALERELVDRARHSGRPGETDSFVTGDAQKPHKHFITSNGETRPAQHLQPGPTEHALVETDRGNARETFKEIKDSAGKSENDSNQGSGEESRDEGLGATSYDAGYSVNDAGAGPEGEVDEEDILRTVLLTLRDNPDLIKILMETEDKAFEDEFSKQKEGVSDPESAELWGNFPDEQSPKQIEKKAGHRSSPRAGSNSESVSFADEDGVIQLPVNTAERQPPNDEEIKADVSLESEEEEQPIKPQSSGADAGLLEDSAVNSERPPSRGGDSGRLLEDGFVDSDIPQSTGGDNKGFQEDGFVDSDRSDVTDNENKPLLEDGFVASNRPEAVKGKEPKNEVVAGSLENGVAESDPAMLNQETHRVQKPASVDDNEELELQALSELNRAFARMEKEHRPKLHM